MPAETTGSGSLGRNLATSVEPSSEIRTNTPSATATCELHAVLQAAERQLLRACTRKIRHYARMLRDAARQFDSSVTDTPGAAFQVVEDGLPLVYRDTNTTRAGLTDLNNLFRGHTVAIVGLGGTGSYILDQVAKTWVDRIILIDGDDFENHNAFRAPGAAAHEALQAKRNKAQYFAEEYSRMQPGSRPIQSPLRRTI